MATFTVFDAFIADLFSGNHDFSTDLYRFYLTNQTPNAATNAIKSDLVEIEAGNGYEQNGVGSAIVNFSQVDGFISIEVADPDVIIASGDADATIGPFRYVVFYNSTTVNDPLVAYFDYRSSITMNINERFAINPTGVIIAGRFLQ
jgi:hypothetical protein